MNFKKNLLVIALLLCTMTSFAQEIKEEAKDVFKPHWFMMIQGGVAHTLGEAKFKDLNSPAAALYFGYQFNPVVGLRFGASGWQAKGGWATTDPATTYKFKFIQGNVDVMANLSNWFGGYKAQRAVSFYGFLGGAYNYAYDNDEAVALTAKGYDLRYIWDDSKSFVMGRGGLGMDIRIIDQLFFNIEANANITSDHFNSKKAGNPDWQFNLLGGFNIKLGKTYTHYDAVYYEPTPAPKEEPKPVVKKEEPKPVEKPVVKEEVKPLIENIFFEINKSVIRTSEEQKINDIVSYMTKYPESKISVIGYADAKTGNEAINQRLSKERAAAVVKALQNKGIAADRISSEYKGDTVQPFKVNEENRVAICITK